MPRQPRCACLPPTTPLDDLGRSILDIVQRDCQVKAVNSGITLVAGLE